MTFARAEILTNGGYGAVNENVAREFVCTIVKIRQRETMVASNLLLASSSLGNNKSASEMLGSFLDSVYSDNETRMQDHDAALKKELELMNQVDWASCLSIPEYAKKDIKESTRIAKEFDSLEDIL